MRIGWIADLHLSNFRYRGGAAVAGVNARAALTATVLRKAVAQARHLQCSALIVLGDTFDTSHPWPQLIALLQGCLDPAVPTYFIKGNHDEDSSLIGDHALGPVATQYVTIVEEPAAFELGEWKRADGMPKVQVGLVPFRPGPATEWFPQAVSDAFKFKPSGPGIPRVLGFHLGVSDEETAAFLKGADDSLSVSMVEDVCQRHGVTAAFCGNWHTRRRWDLPKMSVLQVGTLSPTGYDNPGVDGYGTLAVWDSDAETPKAAITHLVLPGPRFLQVTKPREFPALAKQATRAGHTVFARFKVSADFWEEAVAITQGWMDTGLCEFAEPVLDDEEAVQAARDAVQAARGSESLDQAMAAYVGEMPLAPGVERGAVLAEVQGCLQTARSAT